MKPKILLIADSVGWAFDARCKALQRYLSEYYTFTKVYFKDMPNIDYTQFDLFYYSGFNMIGEPRDKCFNSSNFKQRITTVAGLVSWNAQSATPYLNQTIAYSVVNKNFYKQLHRKTSSKAFIIPNGVDTDLFKIDRGLFTVGWTGHSKHRGKRLDFLKKTIKSIEGVELKIQDKCDYIPQEKMPEFYESIDCYCCVSESEGCNNPVLEAASCSIPIIATDTGTAKEIIKDNGGIIVKDDLSDLRDAIIEMRTRSGQDLRGEMIKNWTWEKRALEYKELFDYALEKRKQE